MSGEWLAPKLISEIVGRSEFVFASSLHACITALSYGVPGARVRISSGRNKFELLDEFAGIVHIEKKEALSSLVNRGRRIEPQVIECADRLDRYWDEVTDVVLQPPIEHSNLSTTLMRCWVAKACGDKRRLGVRRRLLVILRESVTGHFPNERVALRRGLCCLKDSVIAAFKLIAHIVTADWRTENRGRDADGSGGRNWGEKS